MKERFSDILWIHQFPYSNIIIWKNPISNCWVLSKFPTHRDRADTKYFILLNFLELLFLAIKTVPIFYPNVEFCWHWTLEIEIIDFKYVISKLKKALEKTLRNLRSVPKRLQRGLEKVKMFLMLEERRPM